MSQPSAPEVPVPEPVSPARQAWRMFRAHHAAMAGLAFLGFICLVSIVGPYLYTVSPRDMVWAPFTPPGASQYILGTDYLGRDLLAGLINGGRITITVGLTAALIAVTIGVTVGAFAGFFGGQVDNILMRITEFFQVLPYLLFAMVVVMLFSPTIINISIAIGIVSWTDMARLTRGEFMRVREMDYVKAERSIGARNAWLIWAVILPNAAPPLIVVAALAIGNAILFEAGLSFLGLSDPNTMSWGRMIGDNRPFILDNSWGVTLPGTIIFLTVLAVSLVGDGLNDALNPKLRHR
ncbi:ABC transporter permease [Pelagibius litoralis]|uniref:ABC transporter permease n=1 Tax=Pelagibius litoralis TaxID=374515 RepID=A0A967K8D7_9PROT|nr:ABC transporter permease [Pelagibius litoralis]